MAIEIQGNVPLIAQAQDGLCWYASARMLYEWTTKAKGTSNGMIDPTAHKETSDMAANNRAFPYDQVYILRDWLKMKERDVTWDFDGISSALKTYGPLWVAGYKGYYHVRVVLGVADTGVLVHDPEPVRQGTRDWKTWNSINSFLTARDDIDINVLSCP